jgi:SRSO17 transposase
LLISGTKITLDVANKTTTSLLDVSSGSDQIDWEVLVTRTDWKDPAVQERLKKARKCEILIPNIVPITYIRNL